MKPLIDDFLAQKTLAVAGVSRDPRAAANIIFKKLRGCGYEVFPLNPNAAEIAGEPCFPAVRDLPRPVEGVVIATHPRVTPAVVDDCLTAGVPRIWMHRSFGPGSVSAEAADRAREGGIAVIPDGCPMMFCDPVDFPHRCMRWMLKVSGRLKAPGSR